MAIPHTHHRLLLGILIITLSACSTPDTERNTELSTATTDTPHSEKTPVTPKQPASARVTPVPATPSAPVQSKAEQKIERDAISALSPAKRMADASHFESHVASGRSIARLDEIRIAREPLDRENYAHYSSNPVKRAAEFPVSTFSIDVDTGSYSNIRRMLREGRLPPQDAVRVEELVNYFGYDYPRPSSKRQPFQVTTEMALTPWNPKTHLLQIGIQGYEVEKAQLPAANLVFLIDVSGSMQAADKLGLLKSAMKLLAKQLRPQDRVAIAVYAGASGVVLEPVAGNETFRIEQAIDGLQAGGSTNGAAGIRLAYDLAASAFVPGGINRVLLATDGDFNVGTVNFEALIDMVEEKRKSGIALTTLGFGSGNYNDHLMEQLADAGNGNHAYIDSLHEAQKVLVDQVGSTLHTIAKDVKIQIEFNPAQVAEYRLIGYENRMLAREDFNNDKIDAGEIGAGHSVTALYEVALAGQGGERIDPLRYGTDAIEHRNHSGELAQLRLRYKALDSDTSRLIETPILKRNIVPRLAQTSDRFRFAAAVAGFGQRLRGGDYLEQFDYPALLALARSGRGNDPFGYRGEFIQLLSLAQTLSAVTPPQARNTQE